jgi:hypothetical protein
MLKNAPQAGIQKPEKSRKRSVALSLRPSSAWYWTKTRMSNGSGRILPTARASLPATSLPRDPISRDNKVRYRTTVTELSRVAVSRVAHRSLPDVLKAGGSGQAAPRSPAWTAPATTPTRTSRSATWPGCGRELTRELGTKTSTSEYCTGHLYNLDLHMIGEKRATGAGARIHRSRL